MIALANALLKNGDPDIMAKTSVRNMKRSFDK
jgi:hypothetical protein